jgi:hypothetical protein
MTDGLVVDPRSPDLPVRHGPPPLTTRPSAENPFPHQQVTQTAPADLQERLFRRAASLPGVTARESCVSVPGARAFHLDEDMARGPAAAFQCAREFAHLHPPGDGSMHLTLPASVYADVRAKGWGEPHPISGTMLVFGPRDEAELETAWQILLVSYRYALGDLDPDG